MNKTHNYLRQINDTLERIADALEKENTATVNSDVDLNSFDVNSEASELYNLIKKTQIDFNVLNSTSEEKELFIELSKLMMQLLSLF